MSGVDGDVLYTLKQTLFDPTQDKKSDESVAVTKRITLIKP